MKRDARNVVSVSYVHGGRWIARNYRGLVVDVCVSYRPTGLVHVGYEAEGNFIYGDDGWATIRVVPEDDATTPSIIRDAILRGRAGGLRPRWTSTSPWEDDVEWTEDVVPPPDYRPRTTTSYAEDEAERTAPWS